MEEAILKYGLAGICIAGLSWFILYLMKEHKEERKEWKEAMEKISDKMDERSKDSNNAVRENTTILSGLKTLLESTIK